MGLQPLMNLLSQVFLWDELAVNLRKGLRQEGLDLLVGQLCGLFAQHGWERS